RCTGTADGKASGGRKHELEPQRGRDEPPPVRVHCLALLCRGGHDCELAPMVHRAGSPRRGLRDHGGAHRASDPLPWVDSADHLLAPGEATQVSGSPGEDDDPGSGVLPEPARRGLLSNRPDPETMATPPSAPRGTTRRTFDRRVLLALAAVVSLIIVGLYQFDQVVASIYAYAFGAIPRLVGSPLVIAGILLIYKGWKEIVFKRGTVLVTDGIYAMVRHPQYLGFLLVTLGQFVVWPTIPTAILWPLLAVLYYRQAKREDAALSEAFGERFLAYAKKTPMFLPKIRMPRGPKPVPP